MKKLLPLTPFIILVCLIITASYIRLGMLVYDHNEPTEHEWTVIERDMVVIDSLRADSVKNELFIQELAKHDTK